jgi:chemotaxis protein CheZ
MKMDRAETLQPAEPHAVPPQVFQQIGTLARVLHDALHQVGVMPHLHQAAQGLPDVRSRLSYIADKTAEAAGHVLDSVEQAKLEHLAISQATHAIAQAIAADPAKAVAGGAVLDFVQAIQARTGRIDAHLTEIMVAQEFHDLTGQVLAHVVQLARQLEDSLLALLVQVVPPEQRCRVQGLALHGPVVDASGRTDIVTSQREADELLASLGF